MKYRHIVIVQLEVLNKVDNWKINPFLINHSILSAIYEKNNTIVLHNSINMDIKDNA